MTTPIASRAAGRRWAVVTAVSGTVFIAAGAFWLSFTALADLARRSGIDAGQAWAWPLIVDGIIVVATVAVVAYLVLVFAARIAAVPESHTGRYLSQVLSVPAAS